MATLTGVNGAVTMPSGFPGGTDASINFFEWHASFDHDFVDDSDYSDATNAKKKVGLMYDLKGTAKGTMAASALPVVTAIQEEHATPDSGFILQAMTGFTYTFSGVMPNFTIDHLKTDRVFVTVSFESSGEVTRNVT